MQKITLPKSLIVLPLLTTGLIHLMLLASLLLTGCQTTQDVLARVGAGAGAASHANDSNKVLVCSSKSFTENSVQTSCR